MHVYNLHSSISIIDVNFIQVPQAFDPANYYAQLYRAGLDGDGRISPFHTAGSANKYNGNAALVPAQNSQSPQEVWA